MDKQKCSHMRAVHTTTAAVQRPLSFSSFAFLSCTPRSLVLFLVMVPNATQVTRFKDTLSVNNQEHSAWSPLTSPASSPPATAKTLFTRLSQARPRSASTEHNDFHSRSTASLPPLPRLPAEPRSKTAFGRMFRRPTSPTLPTISKPMPIRGYGTHNFNDLPSFGPLTSQKPQRDSTRRDPIVARRNKRRNIYVAAGLIGATILIVVVILVVRLIKSNKDSRTAAEPTPPSPEAAPSSTLAPSSSALLTPEQSKCLTDFTTSAPSAPLDYPASCLKTLQSVSAEFTTADPAAADIVVAAEHFSALRLLFDGCSTAAQQGLNAGGWFKDTKFCVWTGVKCGGSGRVSQL